MSPGLSRASVAGVLLTGLACAEPPHNADVRHDHFWGAWHTEAPVQRGFASTELDVTMSGTAVDGRDGEVRWASTSMHGDQGADAGCRVDVDLQGSFVAPCLEVLQPDPNNPDYPLGEARPGGCLTLRFDVARIRREACADSSRDHAWRPLEVRGLNRGAFEEMAYVRSADDTLALDWEGWVVVHRRAGEP